MTQGGEGPPTPTTTSTRIPKTRYIVQLRLERERQTLCSVGRLISEPVYSHSEPLHPGACAEQELREGRTSVKLGNWRGWPRF